MANDSGGDAQRLLAFDQLNSKSPHERLRAARFLSRIVGTDDLSTIESAARRENTAFVKGVLDTIVARLRGNAPAPNSTYLTSGDLQESASKAEWRIIERVTGTLLHEILPKVGDIEFEASREMPDYEASKLRSKIEGLKGLLDGLEDLQSSTSAKRITEFEIFRLLSEAVEDENGASNVQFGDGERDLVVVADPNLIKLAFCNGLRNAIEAVSNLEEPVIVVTWGRSDIQYYVNIIDQGPGLSGSEESALTIGRSTKSGHRGLGLSIAQGAMATLDGEISLRPNDPHGTIFAMKWYIP